MATGRTTPKWTRIYLNGYNYSGISRAVGPLSVSCGETDMTTLGDSVKGYLSDAPQINVGTLNLIMNATGANIFDGYLAGDPTYPDTVLIAYGIRGEPAQGDPVFMFKGIPLSAQTEEDGGAVTVTRQYSGWDPSDLISYTKPWGRLLHAYGAETGANTAAGIDDYGAATTAGGWMMYQILAGDDGTVTLSVDDSANNSTWLALSGATSGVINATAGTKGIVKLGTTATVRQYLRWQVALGTAATVTFVLGFVRG